MSEDHPRHGLAASSSGHAAGIGRLTVTLATVIATSWVAVFGTLVAACRASAMGDRALAGPDRFAAGDGPDGHEYELAE